VRLPAGYGVTVGEVGDRIEAALVGGIERGDFRAGDKLPSERALAAEHGASRTTVRLVLVKLAAMGLVEPQHGRGYFVRGRSGRARRANSEAKASGR
jgi:DNA-binding FadR family transcriptional regulator